MAKPRVVIEGYLYLEGPRWHEGWLWLSDFYTYRVVSVRSDGSDVRVEAEVAGQPSGLGWLPDGRLLVVSMRDRRLLRREADGSLIEHADLSEYATGHLNDMFVDGAGRAYVGNFGFALMSGENLRTADVVRVDPDGAITVVARDLYFPNGTILIDGELIVPETLGNRLSAFPVASGGGLGERRDWARSGDPPTSSVVSEVLSGVAVAPDGICGDAEGAVWAADALGDRAVRVRRGGAIVDEVTMGTGVYACVLGGDDGRTLYLCSAPGSPSTSGGTRARRGSWLSRSRCPLPEPAGPTPAPVGVRVGIAVTNGGVPSSAARAARPAVMRATAARRRTLPPPAGTGGGTSSSRWDRTRLAAGQVVLSAGGGAISRADDTAMAIGHRRTTTTTSRVSFLTVSSPSILFASILFLSMLFTSIPFRTCGTAGGSAAPAGGGGHRPSAAAA
jgi:sugar lactone lactonase YvrE